MPGPEPFDDWRMSRADLPRYVEWVLEARERSAPFPVRLGLECDFIAGQEAWIEELAAAGPVGLPHRQRALPRAGLGRGQPQAPRPVHGVGDGGRGNLGPVLARLRTLRGQRVVRFRGAPGPREEVRPPSAGRPAPLLRADDCRRRRQRHGHRSEHGGVAQAGGRTVPSAEFLALAHAAGVPVVINSDAHAPGEVGQDFDRAVEAVRAAGYTQTARFAGRRREQVPLG